MKKRFLCLLLVAVLIVPMLLQSSPMALSAGTVTKRETTRAIAVVFDNSGSMWSANPKAWCRATYAMEVFASMMNKGDQLMIYFMNDEVKLGGKDGTPIDSPMVLTDPKDAGKIRTLFHGKNGADTLTPFKTAEDAFAGLKSVKADEKHLIILTDGDFEDKKNVPRDMKTEIQPALNAFAKEVNVMYLAIGTEVKALPNNDEEPSLYIRHAKESSDTITILAEMCNRIFGRNTLPEANVSGGKITFDVSMSKLILFIQGEGIDNVKLSGGKLVSQQAVKYAEQARTGTYEKDFDPSLQGMIVTYENLDAGSYDLTFDGTATSTEVYYEPDVMLQVLFESEEHGIVNPADDTLYSGKYTMKCQMVDNKGNPTTSKLLGNVDYSITYVLGGETKGPFNSTSAEVDLPAEAELSATFTVNYLKGYSITLTSQDLGWSEDGKIKIDTRPAGDFKMEVTGGKDSYSLSSFEKEAVYQVAFVFDGEKLTGEQLNSVTFEDPKLEGGNAKVVTEKTDTGYTVRLAYNGDAPNTQTGEHKLVFSAVHTNVDGVESKSGKITKNFSLEDDSSDLGVELVFEQQYYVLSELEKGKPIIVKVTFGGVPMTAEQFATTEATVTVDGIACDVEPDADNSRYIVTLKKAKGIEKGKHGVTCTVTAMDAIGREVSASDEGSIECQDYPAWVYWVFWILVVLAIATVIYLYLSAKILPNLIKAGNGSFNVEGENVTGTVQTSYSGKGKKTGSLTVQSPKCMGNPRAKCGFTLDLVADSPRSTRSSSRRVRVVGITPMNASTTVVVQVGSTRMTKDPNSNKLVKAGGRPDAPIDFTIGNNCKTMVSAEIIDMSDGTSINCTLTVPLKFY